MIWAASWAAVRTSRACGGTGSGKFDVADAFTLPEILKWSPAELAEHVIPFLKLKQYE
jgi:hypothetical protein